jgi:hypothetical protein
VYATCIFCHAPLGANEAIEHFQVGRRLAFDAAKGRLWVVCRVCERWNLTPLEERWEAIEECEKLFRETKLRVSTDNVGLAKLREGTTLVRIGDPQRPEMAAWRYGDQFGRRRRKYVVASASVAAAVAGVVYAGPIAGLIPMGAINVLNWGNILWSKRTVARVSLDGRVRHLSKAEMRRVNLSPHGRDGWRLIIPYQRVSLHDAVSKDSVWRLFHGGVRGEAMLEGADATDALRHVLPHVNAAGGSKNTVQQAVAVLADLRSPELIFLKAAHAPRGRWAGQFYLKEASLSGVPSTIRLALEMALHETDERRAIEGELAELEERWREAEEVAAISDDMFLPQGVRDAFKRLSGGSSERR